MNTISEVRGKSLGILTERSESRGHKSEFIVCLLFSVFCLLFSVGCGNKFYDPTDIGRFRPLPAVNVILDSLGVAEETPSTWADTEEPKPIDTMVFDTDHAFGPGDVVRISIFELLQDGLAFTSDYIVKETGKISIPERSRGTGGRWLIP